MTTTLSPAHTALLATVPIGTSMVVTTEVTYESEGTTLVGYLAVDSALEGARPGVLVIHDWLGVGEYVRVRCQMLARMGFVAFAPDIYGKGVRPGPAEAPAVAGSFYGNPSLMRSRVLAGLDELRAQPQLDQDRVAAIGYCFGGSVALALAATGADIAGVVSFHGGLSPVSVEDAAGIKAGILVLTGAADPVVPDEAVLAFENSLRAAPDVDWQVVSYAGAMHAFTLPEVAAPEQGANYQPLAERRSWTAMQNFFDEIFTKAV
ncbi:dienelactone hydrolase [Nakamurella sp. UYEF19]|uniref:dienelactone hydrolase family protein n=1 Tax=Nakamurella sp. UYEF19 TaxID=1756392 RepID=UPI003397DAB3